MPAIDAVGFDAFCKALRGVSELMHVPGLGVRVTSELGWITVELDRR